MKDIDTFQFKSPGANEDGGGPVYIDYTPYDDEIPKEFGIEEPAPPPFDTELPSMYPNYDWAMDLIAWALNDIA